MSKHRVTHRRKYKKGNSFLQIITDKDLGIPYPRETEITVSNYTKYKISLNRSDVNKVLKCHEIGYDAWQTAHYMKVTAEAVAHFWPKEEEKQKRTRRTKEEMLAEA